MISLKTVTMQLINGEPDGIRICRVEGESLVTVVVPREKLGEAKTLPELPHRGIYYLLDEDHGTLSRVYAGQTTQGFARLDDHKARKNFWNRAVMFLDDENNIDRDSLDALEAKAIEYVRTHGAYETDNSNTPSPHISPYREQTVEKLHSRILFRMQVLGYDLDRVDKGPVGVESIFHTTRRGISARGQFDKTTGKLTVLAGSQIDLDHPVLKKPAPPERAETYLVRIQDWQFSSMMNLSLLRAPQRPLCLEEAKTAGFNGRMKRGRRSTGYIDGPTKVGDNSSPQPHYSKMHPHYEPNAALHLHRAGKAD